jgi:DNA-binding GntR family transcriptional regulator
VSSQSLARAADRAYARIRADILAGRCGAGEHLKEEELAARVGVSRTSVRDALRRLTGEGLVHFAPNRGAFVARFSPQEVNEIFQLRAALEGYGAALATRRIEEATLARLETLADDMERATQRKRGPDLDRFAGLNNEFHRLVLAASGSTRLAAIVGPLIEIPIILLKQYNWHRRVDPVRSNRQHREIIAALRSRDPIWTRTAMHSHIISTRPRDLAGVTLDSTPSPEIL